MNTPTAEQAKATPRPENSLGLNRAGDAILCIAWGEQDRPDVTLARTVDDVKQFIFEEWIGNRDDPLVTAVMQEIATNDWREDGKLEYELEMGGVTFQDVVDVTPHHAESTTESKSVKTIGIPWRWAVEATGGRIEIISGDRVVANILGREITEDNPDSKEEADAALIVEAVNSYDQLKAQNQVLREVCHLALNTLATGYRLVSREQVMSELRNALDINEP